MPARKSKDRQARSRSTAGRSAAEEVSRLKQMLESLCEDARREAERLTDQNRKLEDSLEHYKALYQEAPIGYAALDTAGIILDINKSGAALLGHGARRLLGRPFVGLVERRDAARFLRHLTRCRAGAGSVVSEVRLRTFREHSIPVELLSQRSWLIGGRFTYHIVIRDLTQRQNTARALQASTKRYRDIVETANEGICIVDQHNQITFVNHRFARMVGAIAEELLGCSADELTSNESLDGPRVAFERRDTGRGGVADQALKRKDGSTLWASVSTTILHDDAGRFAGMLRMYTDVGDRRELDETRQRLVRHLVEAQEAERRRIARELHDQMGQHLVGLSLGLDRLAQLAEPLPEILQISRRLKGVAEVMARDVQHLAFELRPSALDDLGLAEAVSNYADQMSRRFALEIDVHINWTSRLAPAVETTVYRIVQEALTNVVKHAGARRVSVILEPQGEVLQTIIEDDGVGFHADRLARPGARGDRLGLTGMMERATLIGADLQIESRPGHGTTLFLRVPLRSEEQEDHEKITSVTR